MSRRVVLIFGQTGALKEIAINRIRDAFIANEHDLGPNKIDTKIRDSLTQFLDVEEEIKKLHKNDLIIFLKHVSPRKIRSDWREAIGRVKGKMKSDVPIFIGLHGHYSWQGRQFSPISLELLRELEPTDSICLIDDLYCMYARIVNREDIRMEGCYFSLRELALTRAGEIMMSDMIAQEVIPPFDDYHRKNYVISVRQSPEDVYRLLFKQKVLKVYVSYPISRTRFSGETRTEIDAFRDAMKRDFMVFDPLAIDEKFLQFILIEYLWWKEEPVELIAAKVNKIESGIGIKRVKRFIESNEDLWRERGKAYRYIIDDDGADKILLYSEDRWPISLEQAMVDPSMGRQKIKFPIRLDPYEIEEVCSDIDKQIADRDFRLIHQSDAISVYRPYYRGEPSGGVVREYRYATEVEEIKDFVIFHKDEDEIPPGPFDAFPKTFSGNDMVGETKRVIQAMHVYENDRFAGN